MRVYFRTSESEMWYIKVKFIPFQCLRAHPFLVVIYLMFKFVTRIDKCMILNVSMTLYCINTLLQVLLEVICYIPVTCVVLSIYEEKSLWHAKKTNIISPYGLVSLTVFNVASFITILYIVRKHHFCQQLSTLNHVHVKKIFI